MTNEMNRLPFLPREDLPKASPTRNDSSDHGDDLRLNPKPDSGLLYFKARQGKNVLKGSPSNVKGWKNRFFFFSRDDWEILPNTTSNEVPRVPQAWGTPVMARCSFSGGDKDTSRDGAVAALGDEVESSELEMVRAQNQAIELEGFLAQSFEETKKIDSKLQKRNEDVERLEAKVAKLRKNEAFAKENAIKEYKSSDDFHEAVEDSSLKYFGKGFDFFKRPLAHHHPDLGIDLVNMGLDHNLLIEKEKEEEQVEEGEKEKIGKKGK
ncbi:hypothetical protein Acr_00g0086180 [Actinidia rufa]|uniref:Uncharacterized protein n=1 Tax=Actinidia rufa TaxID=165716 RepID=A0A7J0DVN8_9ERIC|nr:hypothetical protein Acr_00g0086180 [Actinidia rufa]